MVAWVRPITLDPSNSKQSDPNLAVRRSSEEAIERTQDPTQPRTSRLNAKESRQKSACLPQGIQDCNCFQTLLCFRGRPENARGKSDRFENAGTGDDQLQALVAVSEQHMLKAVSDKQNRNTTGQRKNIQLISVKAPRNAARSSRQNVREMMRTPEDVRITGYCACKTGAPSAKAQERPLAS